MYCENFIVYGTLVAWEDTNTPQEHEKMRKARNLGYTPTPVPDKKIGIRRN
jgi:hypothetical protein